MRFFAFFVILLCMNRLESSFGDKIKEKWTAFRKAVFPTQE